MVIFYGEEAKDFAELDATFQQVLIEQVKQSVELGYGGVYLSLAIAGADWSFSMNELQRTPVMFVGGTRDYIFHPDYASVLHEQVSNSKLLMLNGSHIIVFKHLENIVSQLW